MSKIKYTVDVEAYICDELEQIRNMIKTLDFSNLPATVERIQYHANRMEQAIDAAFKKKWRLKNLIEDDDDLDDAAFRKKVTEIMAKEPFS